MTAVTLVIGGMTLAAMIIILPLGLVLAAEFEWGAIATARRNGGPLTASQVP